MPVIKFIGRIFPTSAVLSIDIKFPGKLNYGPDAHSAFVISIEKSIISVEHNMAAYVESVHLNFLYTHSVGIAQNIVYLAAFAGGIGLTIILDEYVNPEGTKTCINPPAPFGKPPSSVPREGKRFTELLAIVGREPAVSTALRDLIEGLNNLSLSLVNCARAIEGLRYSMAPTADRKEQWKIFATNLRVERSYFESIINHSALPRHGIPINLSMPHASITLMKTWTIMNRYFEFRHRGGTEPLPLTDFPLLT